MKIRISALLLALLMVVTLFAGCSIGGNSSEEVIEIIEGEEDFEEGGIIIID